MGEYIFGVCLEHKRSVMIGRFDNFNCWDDPTVRPFFEAHWRCDPPLKIVSEFDNDDVYAMEEGG